MVKMLKAVLAWTLSFAMVVQPMMVHAQNIQVVGSDNGPRPRVDQSYNGTPVLNISTPNSKGVSHDIYTHFEANDVIVNNAPTNVNTQLGGWVEGNPNLVPGLKASAWIGEVVGGNQTVLNGILEVAGPSMDVILANEFGIMCNGCGFINANRTTLTTGKPIFHSDGRLSGFDVKQGTVTVGAGGLNPESRLSLSDTSRVDVIARAAAIYGKMRADQVNVVAGANVVNYDWSYNADTGEVSGVTPQEGVGAVPALAVDVAALGGMYANAIQMVATEKGVGVRLDGELVSSSNIALSAQGRLSLGAPASGNVPKIKAKRKIRIRNHAPLLLEGSIVSEQNDLIDIQTSDGTINLSGEISGGAVTLKSAGINAVSGAIAARGELKIESINSDVALTQEANLTAASLNVAAKGNIDFDGMANIDGEANFTSVKQFKTGARSLLEANAITLQGNYIETAGRIVSQSDLTWNSGLQGGKNTGTLSAETVALFSQNKIENSGIVTSAQNLTLTTTTSVTNVGAFVAGNQLAVYADQFINNGGVAWANGDVVLAASAALDTASLLQNTNGRIEALQGDLTIRAKQVQNVGTAPTISASEIIKWKELGNSGPVDPVDQLSHLIDDAYLDANGNILPAYSAQYTALWADLINGGDQLSSSAKEILSATTLNASGTSLKSDFGGIWAQMYSRANAAGTPDPAEAVKALVAADKFDASGNILEEYSKAYSDLWVTLASGDTTVSSSVQDILRDEALSDPATGTLTSEATGLWASMTAGSSASFTVINILYQDRLNDDGILAEIVAGGSIDITAEKVYNTFGAVSAGSDVTIVADEVHNKALGASQVLFQVQKKPGCFTCHTGAVDFYDSFGGRIEGVGAVTISGNLTNETLESSNLGQDDVISLMNSYIAQKKAEGDADLAGVPAASHRNLEFAERRQDNYTAPVEGNGQDIRKVEANIAVDTSEFRNSTETTVFVNPSLTPTKTVGQLLSQGLNTIAETNPEYTNYANYITSNYMMDVDRLQYRDDLVLNTKDAFSPPRLQARVAADVGPLSYLKEAVDVPVPGSTTGEIRTIYPAQQELKVTPAGALIKGQSINISGTDFTNSGNVLASLDTTIDAQNITSTRGTIAADTGTLALSALSNVDLERTKLNGNAIDIVAGQSFIGKGLAITSEGATSIFAQDDAILTSFEVESNYKWGNNTVSSVSNLTSSLDTGGDLSIVSMSDIVLAGVEGTINGGAQFNAIGSLTFAAVENEQSVSGGDHKNGLDAYSRHAIATSLTVGGNLSASASDALTLVGTQLDTAGALSLSGSEVILAAAQDIETFETRKSKKSFFSKKSTTHSTTKITNQGSQLLAGGDVTVTALSGDLVTAGTDFVSNDGNITLNASGQVLAGTYTDIFQSETVKKRSIAWGLISSESTVSKVNQYASGTAALAELDLDLVSGGNTQLIGTSLSAGRNLNINVGGDLDIEAAISSERLDRFSHDVGLVLMTTIQENSFKEYAGLSEFLAEGAVNFTVDGDTRLTLYNQPGEAPVDPSTLYPEELLALQGLNLLERELLDDYFYDEQQALSPAFKALVAIALSATGFGSGLGGALATSIGFSAQGAVAAGFTSFITSATLGVIDGAVSGNFDIGDILKDAAFAGVTAGLVEGISLQTFGVDKFVTNPAGKFVTDAAGNKILTQLYKPLINGFGDGSLSIGNILEGALDGVIREGLSSAVYGTDFGEGLSASVLNTVVNLTLADVQNEIGGLGFPEGSPPHAILHGIAGCAAAEAQGGDCVAGAVGGIAQSLYAGTLDGSTLTREQKLANAKLIGAVAGFFASGGKAQNVSLASSIAESGLANNYLKHQQVSEMARELEECGNTPDCSIEKLIEKYKGLSDDNRAEMLACKTIQCWEKHRDAIIESNKIIGSIGADAFTKGLLADGFEENFVANFAKEENQESIKYISTRRTLALSKQTLETWGKTNCNGVYDLSCVQSFQTQATSESFLSSSIEVIELVTPYGTIVDGYTCATSLSASACVSAIISVIPAGKLAQIGGKVFIRVGGGKIVEATVSAAGKVKTKLFATKGGVCSFHGNTQVLTSDGYSSIKNLKIGMSVWSRNDQSGQMGWKSVLAQYSNRYEETVHVTLRDIETGETQTIISNKIHPFFVQVPQKPRLLHLVSVGTEIVVPVSSEGHHYQGPIANGHWVDASNLKAGYRLLNDNESWAEVVSVNVERKALKAYNLTVADFHTYFVRGAGNDNAEAVWVHNDCFSKIKENPLLVREAQRSGRNAKVQDDIDKLTAQLSQGNINPGIGTKPIGKGISEARGRNGGRVYFRVVGENVQVLGKSGKDNQQRVINEVLRVFGE